MPPTSAKLPLPSPSPDLLTPSAEPPAVLSLDDDGVDTNNDVWPLQLLDFHDAEQMDIVYNLLRERPQVVFHYLVDIVFPDVMRFQGLKLSANGQSLGGSMLFDKRMGFSGHAQRPAATRARQLSV